MQLGPIARMPASFSFWMNSRSVFAISSSPVSEKPAVKKWIERTPFSMHWSTSVGTNRAGIIEIT